METDVPEVIREETVEASTSQKETIEHMQERIDSQADTIARLRNTIHTLANRNLRLRKKTQPKPLTKSKSLHIARGILQQKLHWSKKQIDYALCEKKQARWGKEDLVLGLTIRALSRRTYEFLRKKRLLPLPSVSLLKKHVAKFQCLPGVLTDVIKVIERQKDVLGDGTQRPIPVCLTFDEMKLRGDMQFHQGEQKLYGPYDNVQTAMIRGVFKNFKQPIYFNFDEVMTKATLFEIIDAIDNVGFQVEAVAHDMGGKNMSLWKELGIGIDCSSFAYKYRQVHVLADVPHLLKLLRNHLIDKGFVLKSGTVITKDDFESILSKDCHELRIAHKMRQTHLDCSGSQRQRVSLAAQLLSRSTAKAMKMLFPEKRDQSEFIELINDTFDICNSRSPEGHKQFDYALGWTSPYKTVEAQKEILMRAKEEIEGLRVINEKKLRQTGKFETFGNLLPFQKGWIVSINSVLEVFEKLQSQYNTKFLMTSRLNQDCLENLFSRIRYIGGPDTHPGPVEFISRMKLLILGQSSEYAITTAPVQMDDDEETRDTDVMLSEQLVQGLQPMSTREDDDVNDDLGIGEVVTIQDNTTEVDCSAEAMKYVAGYVAFKFKHKYPELSSEGTVEPPVACPWIDAYSFGGLRKPSVSWFERYEQLEGEFYNLFGSSLPKEAGVINRLEKHLTAKFPDVEMELVKFYSKMRIYIRIKHMRYQYKTNSGKLRNAKKIHHFST